MINLLFIAPVVPALRLFQKQQQSESPYDDELPLEECDASYSLFSSLSSDSDSSSDDEMEDQDKHTTIRSSNTTSTRSFRFTRPIRQITPQILRHFLNDDADSNISYSFSTSRTPNTHASAMSTNRSLFEGSTFSFHSYDELSHVIEMNHDFFGPKIDLDDEEVVRIPDDDENFTRPKNLEHVMIVDLPVGYYRLRKALLFSKNDFWGDMVLSETLKYSKINTSGWDKHNKIIGLPTLPSNIQPNDIIGTTKRTEYLMPKSGIVNANMAYETTTITSYNNHCFAIEMKTSNPDVPFGDQFIAHTKIVVYNKGRNMCQMECSVETIFPNGPPMGVGWQIRKAMKNGSMAVFEKISSSIKKCAFG